jgi:hypothetical protein
MDPQLFGELVARWVSGDRLAHAEEQGLLDWLEVHPEARQELLDDEALDSLLRCWPRLEETSESFVESCLARAGQGPVVSAPIVAPPVASVPLLKPAAGSPSGRFFSTVNRWALAAAGCCAALLLGAIILAVLARGLHPVAKNQPSPVFTDIRESRPELQGAFATLTQSTSAAWETPVATGDRLASCWLKLTSGTAELHFDKGTVASLTGPAVLELRSADEVFLRCGALTARVPPPAVGFSVATPLSRVVDLGTEFDVTVEDSGATQTAVRRGRVSFRPHRGDEDLGTPIELAAEALNHASVAVSGVDASVLPAMIVARGQGRFLGRMSASGKTVEFHSQAAYREFRATALRQLREAPNEFGRKWPGLADDARRAAGPGGDHPGQGGKSASKGAAPTASIPPTGLPAGSPETVEVRENGKTISIEDSKESGITVTVTETVGEKKKTTKVRAADSAELARKNPDAHQLYRKYFHPRPKAGKAK